MCLVVLIWSVVLATTSLGQREYHSVNAKEIARKQRLLGIPGENGGIRERLVVQRQNVSDLDEPLKVVSTGAKVVSAGSDYVSHFFNFVSDAFLKGMTGFKEFQDTLEDSKARLDKKIGSFGSDWEGDMMRKIKQDPDLYNKVFEKFNQAAISEYHNLMELIRATNTSFNKAGRTQTLENASAMKAQNKTLQTIERTLNLGTSAFSGMLNRRVLPLLAGTKFGAGASVPVMQKRVVDSLDQLEHEVLPKLSNEALDHMQTNAENVGKTTQRQIDVAAKDVTKELVKMRSALDRAAQKSSHRISQAFSDVADTINAGNATVSRHRVAEVNNLHEMTENVTSFLSRFSNEVASTSSDLSQTLSAGSAALSGLESESTLGGQQVLSDAGDTLNGLLEKLQSQQPASATNVQQSIGGVYAQGSALASQNLQSGIQPRLAALMRDSGEVSSNLASQFDAVSASTKDLVTSSLQTGVSVENANLQQRQRQAVANAASAAQDTLASIDEEAAESDADRAEVLNKFQAGMNQTASRGSFSGIIGSTISDSSDTIARNAMEGASRTAASLGNSREAMDARESEVSLTTNLLRNLTEGALPQLDSDTEARIQSLLSDLKSVRRQASSEGGVFEANSQEFISKLVGEAVKNVSWGPMSQNLGEAGKNLKVSAAGYASGLAGYQSEMDAKMNKVEALYDALSFHSDIGQVVSHQEGILSDAVAPMLREISSWTDGDNSVITDLFKDGKPLDLHGLMQTLDSQLGDLVQDRASTEKGITEFVEFLSELSEKIQAKLVTDASDPERISTALKTRDDAVAQISSAQADMNRTIYAHIQAANESVTNKTYNFYKEYQTASLVADSLLAGFSDYITRMIAVEKASELTRKVMQANLIDSIQSHLTNSPTTNITDATQLEKLHALVAQAMNTSDTSAEGIAKRKAAQDALIAQYGVSVAQKLQDQYGKLKANAQALSAEIEASQNSSVEDRATSVDASRMGVEGVNMEASLFQGAAGGLLDSQVKNAKAISDKINSLLDGGSFLTNITGSELRAILESVQKGDHMYHGHLSQYRDSSMDQVASLGGVVEDFAHLVSTELNRTRDFLSQLSANYTLLVKQTDAVTHEPINAIKQNFSGIHELADSRNASFADHLLSVGPIEEGLRERLESLSDRQDAFSSNIHDELSDMMSQLSQLDGQVSLSRNAGMGKLRDALLSLKNNFRDQALQFQADKTQESSSLIQTKSDSDLRKDMHSRIISVKEFLRGKNKAL